MKLRALIVVVVTSMVAPAWSADRADLEGTQIRGNRELPKVLYIVPWKRPLPSDRVGRPPSSVLDEALAPVDREVFEREVRYHSILQPPPKGASARAK